MLTSSERMRAAIKGSYTMYTRADLYLRDELLERDLPFIDYEVIEDVTAATRRTMQLTMPGSIKYIPGTVEDLLFPRGTEIQLWAGTVFPDGKTEEVGQGRYRISKPRVTEDANGERVITIDGADRSRTVALARFPYPYTVPSGSFTYDVIEKIVSERIRMLEFIDFGSGTHVTNQLLYDPTEVDPWEACLRLAEYTGEVVYFDEVGLLRKYPIPDPSVEDVVWEFDETAPQGFTLMEPDKELDDEVAYNWVVARGEHSDLAAPVYGEAFDANPESPTYIGASSRTDPGFGGSDFGARPLFVVSEYIQTIEQAETYARGELAKNLGVAERFSFTCSPNMLLAADDAVYVNVPDFKVTGRQIIESKVFNSNPAIATKITCRARRIFD